jgi:hypothetical protein
VAEWFSLEDAGRNDHQMLYRPLRQAAALGFVAIAVAVVVPVLWVAATSHAFAASTACRPQVTAVAIRYCGRATARLSLFPGVVFRNGTCSLHSGGLSPTLSLKLGTRSLKNPFQAGGNNSGLAYFDLSVVGPLNNPTGGGVIVFFKGKHFYGSGVSFEGNTRTGRFVVQGIRARGSQGRATGSYRC